MSQAIKKICVYCASSPLSPQIYLDSAAQLADIFVDNGITTIYGGGATGLMGKLADQVVAREGDIIGIMPQFMKDIELEHKRVEHFHFVADMHERKKMFLEMSDALVTLPGGCGTFEELMEALTLKRLRLYAHPIVIVNINGFYDPLIQLLEKSVEEQFMTAEHAQMWAVVERPDQVLDAIYNQPAWELDQGRI